MARVTASLVTKENTAQTVSNRIILGILIDRIVFICDKQCLQQVEKPIFFVACFQNYLLLARQFVGLIVSLIHLVEKYLFDVLFFVCFFFLFTCAD